MTSVHRDLITCRGFPFLKKVPAAPYFVMAWINLFEIYSRCPFYPGHGLNRTIPYFCASMNIYARDFVSLGQSTMNVAESL